jgi:hypothetical protein
MRNLSVLSYVFVMLSYGNRFTFVRVEIVIPMKMSVLVFYVVTCGDRTPVVHFVVRHYTD